MPPRFLKLLILLAAATYGCSSGRPRISASEVAPGSLPATSTLRVNVINLTGQPAPFIFRIGGVQILDTIAPLGTLPIPVMNRSLQVAPGRYPLQLYARQSSKLAQDSLDAGRDGASHATVELIFDDSGARMTLCYCVRVYGTGSSDSNPGGAGRDRNDAS